MNTLYIKFFKRLFDFSFSALFFPVFVLIYLIIGFLIKLEDRGPVFFKAERIGKNHKLFMMYKFRSMKVNAPKIVNPDGSTFNSSNDTRVTKIGKFIRETSIDEIPQILNVLKGDMSIIGPRASLSGALGSFLDDEVDKMKVLPGITGYTQAFYRNSVSNREKRLKDAWYANNVSFLLDLKIILRTVKIVLRREGLYTNNA